MNTDTKELIPINKATSEIDAKMTLAFALRSFRLGEGLSQVELAKRLNISKQFLNDVESGRKKVGITFLQKFAKELGFSPDTFIALYLTEELREAGILNCDVHLVKKAS